MPKITVADKGEDYEIHVGTDVGLGFVRVVVTDSSDALATLPRLTPFEASQLATLLNRAAEYVDTYVPE